MSFQSTPGEIHWRMHFRSPRGEVYRALATGEGRRRFWAESAEERDGIIEFRILGYPPFRERILDRDPPRLFALGYFGSTTRFTLDDDSQGGTDLTLAAEGVDESIRSEMVAGWVSVLMAMKAAVDFDVDLRNHDPRRNWETGYADN